MEKTYGNPLNRNWGTMLTLSYDSCIVATYCLAYSSSQYCNFQVYITKIGLDGIVKWNKKIGFVAPDNGTYWIQKITDGSLIIGGTRGIKDTITKHIGWLFKLKSNGDSLWYREYAVINGINDANELWQVTPTPDKGFAAAGSLYPNSAGGTQDIWVFKTDSLGCLDPNCHVGITEIKKSNEMVIYPNPAKDKITFKINTTEIAETKLEIYNIQGQIILQKNIVQSNTEIDISLLPQGIYVAKVGFGDGSYTQVKFLVVK